MQRELVLQACQTDSSAGVHAGELDLTGAPGALQHPWTEECSCAHLPPRLQHPLPPAADLRLAQPEARHVLLCDVHRLGHLLHLCHNQAGQPFTLHLDTFHPISAHGDDEQRLANAAASNVLLTSAVTRNRSHATFACSTLNGAGMAASAFAGQSAF